MEYRAYAAVLEKDPDSYTDEYPPIQYIIFVRSDDPFWREDLW
jgi:hypothetical protein